MNKEKDISGFITKVLKQLEKQSKINTPEGSIYEKNGIVYYVPKGKKPVKIGDLSYITIMKMSKHLIPYDNLTERQDSEDIISELLGEDGEQGKLLKKTYDEISETKENFDDVPGYKDISE